MNTQTPIVRRLLPLALACGLLAAVAPAAHAQPAATTPDLFTPLPADAPQSLSATQRQYLDAIDQRPTTDSVTLGHVDVAALAGDKVRIAVSSAKALVFTKDEVTARDEQGFIWSGSFPGSSGETILVVRDGDVTGSILDETTFYQLEPIGGGVHAMITVDSSRFPPDDPEEFNLAQKQSGDKSNRTTTLAPRTNQSLVQIDALVAYTTQAKARVADINAKMALAIAETNKAYENSGIAVELKLVGSFELVDYSEAGKSTGKILDELKQLPIVKTRRTLTGADVVVLLETNSRNCGEANEILADSSTAFAAVNIDCATGCHTFAHEVGHLQGALHDPKTDDSNKPFSFGHGLQHPATNGTPSFHTVMAYACSKNKPCQPQIQYFSNPNRSYQGVPLGTADLNDNARVLNGTAERVAGFMSRPVPGYRFCSLENRACRFAGTKNVAYGANGKLKYKTATGTIQCNTGVFGDPQSGTTNACYVGPDAYTFCANENGRCSFNGTKNVAYGTNGKFDYRTATGGIDCNNRTFNNPINENKACYVGPAGATFCAGETGRCSFTGTKTVLYGANGRFASTRATGGVSCNNATFGDPIPGVGKFCYIVD